MGTDDVAREPGRRAVDGLATVLLAVLGLWLASTLHFVNLEFDDGYTTILNALHFAGISDFYAWPRAPLMGLILAPAAWLAQLIGAHPMDVWPYHAITAVLHWVYLLCVWKMLAAHYGRSGDTLIAYVAAVPTLLFFSYAPFISHDLLPGAILLGMLLLANAHMHRPLLRNWVALVALGAVAAGIKQTYALFWVAVLVANALLAPEDKPLLGERMRRLGTLAAGAALSGAITWCVYAAALGSSFPEVGFLQRPLLQASALSQYFGADDSAASMFYQGVYYRNLHAYGLLVACLILPGLYLGLTAPARLPKTIALVWIMLAVAINLIPMKEVRYLGFLAPLSAALLIPAVARIARIRRAYRAAILAILLLDLMLAGREAGRIVDPYYRQQIADFLAPLPTELGAGQLLILPGSLSFVSPEAAFHGDRYHRITHLLPIHLRVLYGYAEAAVPLYVDANALRASHLAVGDFLVTANQVAVREPPIQPDNRTTLTADFVQLLAQVELLVLEHRGDYYVEVRADGSTGQWPTLLLPGERGSGVPLIGAGSFPVDEIRRLTGAGAGMERIEVNGARIRSICHIDGCRTL